MDFLDIRKKAKERGKARAGGEPPADPAAPPAAGAAAVAAAEAPDPLPPASEPVVTDADVLEGALAARLQGLPPPGGAAEEEARPAFTTWRPGSGAPPAPPELQGAGAPAPRPEDFTVLVGPPPAPAEPAPRRGAPPAPPVPPDPLDVFFYRPDEEAPQLPQLGPGAEPAEAAAEHAAREEYLTFVLGAEEYAVAIERVREVVRAPPVTEVPRAPSHILGVVTVRGEVVAVVDPRRRLALAPRAPSGEEGKVIIVDAGEGPCGLLVDAVASVVRLAPGSIEPCPQGIAAQASSDCLAGIGREGERLFTVLDLGALLRRAPAPGAAERRADAR